MVTFKNTIFICSRYSRNISNKKYICSINNTEEHSAANFHVDLLFLLLLLLLVALLLEGSREVEPVHVGLDNVGHDVLGLLDPLQPARDRDEHVPKTCPLNQKRVCEKKNKG